MMQPAGASRQWDTDDRHEGVADASSFAAWDVTRWSSMS